MDSPFRTRPSIGIPLGFPDKEIIVGDKKPSEGTKERLSGKRLGIVYGGKGMEQVCSLNDMISGPVEGSGALEGSLRSSFSLARASS